MYLYRLEAETSAGLLALVIAAEGRSRRLPPRKNMCGGIFRRLRRSARSASWRRSGSRPARDM